MELDKVKALIKMLQDANLSHLEIDDKQGHIILKQKLSEPATQTVVPTASQQAEVEAEKTINAPFVGTFYVSEQPDKAPMIKAGDTVAVGQSVGIIEAMKMMNEVKSEVEGTIDKVLVSNGETVEFDQPLFTLKD
ncbi:acetyl-CoA carboxylase biotin carboxyl carrier protein [Companilactobacillus mishanensis]|uniref:Biotin carboxyl carrier protein of acetyl-CoA carboxylase n=1 Tax=Companilactobacillus mishanensis TaxID=2486008 RepID=A0A5P0ZK96_9LACO|nr:biotin/lipoyl-containing protein [Companilactobacillus mishanensis]MQS53107.1 acetyl-CoA carboxylase biotin carboxyl carrier protein subunit [Companilactobacillus mishanensis]